MAFGDKQDTHPYVAVLDRNTGRYHFLDTRNSRVEGRPTRIPLGFGIHSAYIDRTGRYVVIGKGVGRKPNTSEWVVWDVDTSEVAEITNHWSGHDASGFGVRVNESGYSGGSPSFYEEVQYSIRPLDPAHVSEAKYLIDPANLPTPHLPITGGHFSWNNARPEVLVPVVGSHFREVKNAGKPWRALDDEIIAVATDGSGAVWRFAHHRSLTDGDFWDTPRGNVSQDGRWYLFTSNWERTLGSDPYDKHPRQDMFLVELPAPQEQENPAAAASVTLTNLTRPGQDTAFKVGDNWTLTVNGPRNQTVALTATHNGNPGSSSYGQTDASGHFSLSGFMYPGTEGTWTEAWAVGSVQATPTLYFVVSP